MIQDQLKFDSANLKLLRLKCYLCQDTMHLINKCPLVHFYPDSEKVIKKSEFPHPQSRVQYKRKAKKKIKWTRLKTCPIKSIPKEKIEDQEFSSSDEDLDSPLEVKEKHESDNNINLKPIDLSPKRSNNANELFIDFKSGSPRNKRKSCLLEVSRKNFDFGSEENILTPKTQNKSDKLKYDENSNESHEVFEKPKEMKKYFPFANLSIFQSEYEKGRALLKRSHRKAEILKKIANYSFNLELMYREIIGKQKQYRKGAKIISRKGDKSENSAKIRQTVKRFSFLQLKKLQAMRKKSKIRKLFVFFKEKVGGVLKGKFHSTKK